MVLHDEEAPRTANGKQHTGPGAKPAYGADVTKRQYMNLIVALCMGTLIEWYDFTVYSQLANVLTKLFFPSKDPTTSQLSFWGVYAVGFISRPLGSIIFGSIGDSHGRRITMLLSIASITVPSILIGCLPTFYQAGIVAPILMALLRLVQGLAVGGEFGSAITYLFELAPAHHKGVIASLGQMAIAPGIALGIIVVQILYYTCPQDHLELWGWRVPFLVTCFTAPIALVLRMHMPEPTEFLASRQVMVLQHVTSTAAGRVARSFTRTLSREPSAGLSRRLSARQVSLRLQGLGEIGDISNDVIPEEPTAAPSATATAIATTQQTAPAEKLSHGAATTDAAGAGGAPDTAKREFVRRLSSRVRDTIGTDGALGCEAEFEGQVQQLAGRIKHHVPLLVLFRDHWKGVVLQTLMEAIYGGAFYTFYSWVPPYLQTHTGVSVPTSLWAVLIGMVLFPAAVVTTGHLIGDGAAPKVWSYVAFTAAVAALSPPALLWLNSGGLAALFVALPLMLALIGTLGGMMTTIGPQIFPAGCRATGYNLGHNLAMSIFGGLCPLMITAMSVRVAPPALAAGVVLLILAAVSLFASPLLALAAPHLNARCPAGDMLLIPRK